MDAASGPCGAGQGKEGEQKGEQVRAGSAHVTAIGTAFDVRMSEDRTVVAGTVEFRAMPQIAANAPDKSDTSTVAELPPNPAPSAGLQFPPPGRPTLYRKERER
jgi:hypothetical protein